MRASAFRSILRSIADGDDASVRRQLEETPGLASATAEEGATRASAKPFFLAAVGHYVYAGDTALHIAAAGYRVAIARDLLARGADANAVNRRGATPLHYASAGGPGSAQWNPAAQAAVINELIAAGADPNAIDKSGVAPLHVAVRSRCASAVRTLLSRGADSRRMNRSGSTPLHLAVQTTGRGGSGTEAAQEQQATIIRLLVDAGGRFTDKNSHGKRVDEYVRGARLAAVVDSLAL